MIKKKYALISVFDKKNISIICKALKDFNVEIISTGSTAKEILKIGYKCTTISQSTKFPEILDGRVKTLHSKIYASILHDRGNKEHVTTFNKLKFPDINFVFVNLYPFDKVIKSNNNFNNCIEMLDIGGPTLLRAAGKNFYSITAICNTSDYKKFAENIKKNNGNTSLNFRKKMAEKVFIKTSHYDEVINKWLKNKVNNSVKKIKLKYGENPNQKSYYQVKNFNKSFVGAKINGKDLGFNNILDLDSGINCIKEFSKPTCIIIKHNNPCGAASAKDISIAFSKALNSDSISAFGGVVIFNKIINEDLAKKLFEYFFEVIAASNFTKKALNILQKKKNLILIRTSKLKLNKQDEIKNVIGGSLIQERNKYNINKKNIICATKKTTSNKNIDDLIFAYKISKHVKSNAIVLVRNLQTIGIGAGQMSRIDSTRLALMKKDKNKKVKNYVAASDAFFPFLDNIKLLIKDNCISIIQPAGSINDKKNIDFLNKKNISLYYARYRVFKH